MRTYLPDSLRAFGAAAAVIAVLVAPPAAADDADVVAAFESRLSSLEADASALSSVEYDAAGVSIGALAAQLRTAQACVDWVSENTTLDPYVGVLRSARGALFSRGGNSLDRSLLLGELLEAQGIQWSVAVGDLSDDSARTLAATTTVTGTLDGDGVPSSLAGYSPGADGSVRGAIARHYWVRARVDGDWVNLDPSFPGLEDRAAATELSAEYAPDELPDELDRNVTVGVYFETTTSQGGVSLSHSSNMAELGYRNLTLYFDRAGERMTPRLETPTGEVSGSSIPAENLERLWVQFVFQTGDVQERIVRDLYDANSRVDVTDADDMVFSVVLLPGFVGDDYFRAVLSVLVGGFGSDAQELRSVIAEQIDLETLQTDVGNEIATVTRDRVGTAMGIVSLGFAHLSDRVAMQTARALGVRPYYSEPRVLIAGAFRTGGAMEYELDLRSNEISALAADGVPAPVVASFLSARGRTDAALSGFVLEGLTGQTSLDSNDCIEAAASEGASLVTVHPGTVRRLGSLSLSGESMERLEREVSEFGGFALAPNRSGGDPDTGLAWWRISPGTGSVGGVVEHGTQGASTFLGTGFAASDGQGGVRVNAIDATLQLLEEVVGSASDVALAENGTADLVCDAACDVVAMRRTVCSDERERSIPRTSTCLRGETPRDGGALVPAGTSCSAQLFSFYCGANILESYVTDAIAYTPGLGAGHPSPFASISPTHLGQCECGAAE